MAESGGFDFAVGTTLKRSIYLSKLDIEHFADLTKDHAPHHVDAAAAQEMGFEREMAHGLLILGLTGQLTSAILEELQLSGVTYGYDRVRFMAPVYPDSPLDLEYSLRELRTDKPIVVGDLRATQQGALCMMAEHLLFLT